jgi:phenylacetate-CoA ligase
MPQPHYDDLETRDPAVREREQFACLRELIASALAAPGWARQLVGIDPHAITDRAALARLPLLHKSDLVALQKELPPFGGFNVAPLGQFRRLLISPGPIFEPERPGEDVWGSARALFAAGFRAGDIVHNAFSYHLTPGGFIMESGLHALGCAVIPGGVGATEQQLEAIARFAPTGYAGTPDFLKVLLDGTEKSGQCASFKRALVSGAALPATLRHELTGRGVEVLQCYATADVGVIAYERPACQGMIVNETLIVEIVRPGSGEAITEGDVGEVVVTSLNPDYPMVRLATGDLTAAMPGRSPCGRTNLCIKGWLGRADQSTKIRGLFVHPAQLTDVARRHPELARVQLRVTRAGEQDIMTLMAECAVPTSDLAEAIAGTLRSVTRLKGAVRLVAPNSLSKDDKLILDERSY